MEFSSFCDLIYIVNGKIGRKNKHLKHCILYIFLHNLNQTTTTHACKMEPQVRSLLRQKTLFVITIYMSLFIVVSLTVIPKYFITIESPVLNRTMPVVAATAGWMLILVYIVFVQVFQVTIFVLNSVVALDVYHRVTIKRQIYTMENLAKKPLTSSPPYMSLINFSTRFPMFSMVMTTFTNCTYLYQYFGNDYLMEDVLIDFLQHSHFQFIIFFSSAVILMYTLIVGLIVIHRTLKFSLAFHKKTLREIFISCIFQLCASIAIFYVTSLRSGPWIRI